MPHLIDKWMDQVKRLLAGNSLGVWVKCHLTSRNNNPSFISSLIKLALLSTKTSLYQNNLMACSISIAINLSVVPHGLHENEAHRRFNSSWINWLITHIKAHSLQSLMHTYFLWKRPKATQFDLGFFITPDRPYTLHIGLKNGVILTFWGFMFNIQGVYPGKKQSYKK